MTGSYLRDAALAEESKNVDTFLIRNRKMKRVREEIILK